MLAQRWDFETKEYKPYYIIDEATLLEWDMDKIIQCAECAEETKYGAGYTSRQIHNNAGLGYSVCGTCYDREWIEEGEAHKYE